MPQQQIHSYRFAHIDLFLETTPEHPHKEKAPVAGLCATIPKHLHYDSAERLRARNAYKPTHSGRFAHVGLLLEATPAHPHKAQALVAGRLAQHTSWPLKCFAAVVLGRYGAWPLRCLPAVVLGRCGAQPL